MIIRALIIPRMPREDQRPMDDRLARLETDVGHIKQDVSILQTDVRELRKGLQAANDAIADLRAVTLTAVTFSIAKVIS